MASYTLTLCLAYSILCYVFPVGHSRTEGSDLYDRICACVWNEDSDPGGFELEWNNLINEYDLASHDWLCQLYKIREMWIPAYSRDVLMGGLLRTTSRSECENSFFTSNTNPFLTLVEFYMRYETCIEAQRYNQAKKDNDSEHKCPELKTPFDIEKHAAAVYTIKMFYSFQIEMETGSYRCGLHSVKVENGLATYTVKQLNSVKMFDVVFDESSMVTTCGCKLFQRKGIPCRHMLFVWNSKLVLRIPDQYVLPRWCKSHLNKCHLDANLVAESPSTIGKKRMINSLWLDFHACFALALHDDADMLDFTSMMRSLRDKLESKRAAKNVDSRSSKVSDIELLTGFSAPSSVIVKPPKISKNKGSGVHPNNARKDNRLKSEKEKAVEESRKKQRLCRACNEYATHDSRNCPNKPKIV